MEVPQSLHQLKSAASPQDQLAALKQLKNDIIGHEQKKEAIIRNGVVAELVRALESAVKSRGKKKSLLHDSLTGLSAKPGSDKLVEWDFEDQVRIQSVFIVTSLAHGKLC